MMKRAALLIVLASCGGKIEEVGTSPAPTTVPTPTVTGTSVPPSPPSTGPTPTTPPKDPSPTSTKVLTAQAVPGGRDHLMIFAADPVADSCIRVHLASPAASPQYPNVVTPKAWGVEDIARAPGAKRCGPGKQPPAAEQATDAKGEVSWVATSGAAYPCSINVFVTALFTDQPSVETIDGQKITVDGCF
jgi:hypothetical protein